MTSSSSSNLVLWWCSSLDQRSHMITSSCLLTDRLPRAVLWLWSSGETKDEIERSTLAAPLVAHAGDGNFHAFIMVDPNSPEEVSL